MRSRNPGIITLLLALLVACLALLCATATSARASTWSGTVTDETGAPLPGIAVTMRYLADPWYPDLTESWRTVMETTSGADGHYGVSHSGFQSTNIYELEFRDPAGLHSVLRVRVADQTDWGVFDLDVALTGGTTGPDITPPVTSDGGDHGWLTTSGGLNMMFRIYLTATDDLAGVAATYFRGSGQTEWTRGSMIDFMVAADHSSDGISRYEYYSVDNAGNAETPKAGCVRIDTTEPVASVPADQTSHGSLELSVADNLSPTCDVRVQVLRSAGKKHRSNGSGVVVTDITVRLPADGSAQSVALPERLPARSYQVRVTATDLAGNTQSAPATGVVRVRP